MDRSMAIPRTRLPRTLRKSMAKAGAEVDALKGEGLSFLRIEGGIGSQAWRLYRDWCCRLRHDVKPTVKGLCGPPAGTDTVPDHLYCSLLIEFHSIIYHFASLPIEAFGAGTPEIPGPFAGARSSFGVVAKAAVCDLVDYIKDPPADKYPIISGLTSGSYICHLFYRFYAAAIMVPIFRA